MAKVFWTAVNTEKNHTASSSEPPSNGHGFHRKHNQLGTVFWWISRPERWIPRNPASTLLRPWFSWPTNIKFRDPNESKLESNPDPVYLRFQNIDFGLWMSRRFPDWSLIRSWHNFSVGGTTYRASLLKNTQMGICIVIFHSNSQPRSMMAEFGLGSCYIILTGPYSVKSANLCPTWYP